MTNFYMGIDVGLKGALAMSTANRRRVWVKDMPLMLDPFRTKKKTKLGNESKAQALDEATFLDLMKEALDLSKGDLLAAVERQQFFSKPNIFKTKDGDIIQASSKGESKKMEQYGFIKGVLTALEIPFILVHPQTWQAALKFPRKVNAKKYSIELAGKTFPRVELIPPRCRVARDGRADALNILDYVIKENE